ncbi:unnamed protein product [Rotaria sp. Silwood1]|nr:unnamed protein product [Rotaria sp. Silwood1]CAF1058459.1 unnamed protein product [Rotaria sp. Silwood1]CAF1103375.1 unnamed protein product [Rotaria sp. Silwood1]CAF3434401.1 unnamed protein product [Rotaria sp. Silwood1]CAF3456256.1 unnamed protein product [Rotaria sp. Silwood1]
MGSDNSKTSVDYYPRTVPKSILKKQTAYPGTHMPDKTGYPQYPDNYHKPYNGNYTQAQSKHHVPEDSLSSHRHHSRHQHHHRHHHHHRPQHFERETQTTPSILFRTDNPVQKPISITNDGRSTPVLLQENSSSNLLDGLSTPPLLDESSSSSSLDKHSTSPIKKSPRIISPHKSTSPAVVKQLSSSHVNKKH